jgi:hypothetical protein
MMPVPEMCGCDRLQMASLPPSTNAQVLDR